MDATTDPADPLSAPTAALAAAVLEIARHVGDAPLPAARWYALLRSAELLAGRPALASLLGEESAASMAADPLHLTSVELEPDGPGAEPDRIDWPDVAVGGAVLCEIPAGSWAAPGADRGSRLDPALPLRAAVGVLEDGTRWSALRTAATGEFVMGESLLPDLADALAESLGGDQR